MVFKSWGQIFWQLGLKKTEQLKSFLIHLILINDDCWKCSWHIGDVVTKTSILITLHLAKQTHLLNHISHVSS